MTLARAKNNVSQQVRRNKSTKQELSIARGRTPEGTRAIINTYPVKKKQEIAQEITIPIIKTYQEARTSKGKKQ